VRYTPTPCATGVSAVARELARSIDRVPSIGHRSRMCKQSKFAHTRPTPSSVVTSIASCDRAIAHSPRLRDASAVDRVRASNDWTNRNFLHPKFPSHARVRRRRTSALAPFDRSIDRSPMANARALASMTGHSAEECARALTECHDDVDRAIDVLLNSASIVEASESDDDRIASIDRSIDRSTTDRSIARRRAHDVGG